MEALVAALERDGFAVADGLFGEELVASLLSEARTLLHKDEFHRAHIGHGVAEHRISEVRGDSILWLDPGNLTAAQSEYVQYCDAFRHRLVDHFRIRLPWSEMHLAAYPRGSFYTRHVDQFRETNNRIFSFILYLNPDWRNEDGGQLRAYLPQGEEDIFPQADRFVVFRSDLIEHEVLPTQRTRFSITGWMRRDEPTPIFI